MEEGESFTKKIENFVIQKHRLILLAVLVFAFIIRLKYMTVNAAVWWDEADYLSIGKHFGIGTPEIAAPWRARAIPMIWGIFYFLGANEWVIRFFGVLVGVAGIYLTYLVGKALFNKWAGLIAALMLAVYNEHLFWGARISMDIYVLAIWALAAYLFWKAYTENKTWQYIAVGALYGYGIYAYESIGFMFIMILVFLLATERLKFLKNKKVWLMVGAAILTALPLAAYHYVEFGDAFGEDTNFLYKVYPRFGRFGTTDFSTEARPMQDWQRPIGEIGSDFFRYFTSLPMLISIPFFIALIAGMVSISSLFLGLDLLAKEGNMALKKQFYVLLWALVIMVMMGAMVALTGFDFEPRFIFPAMPALFMIAGQGLVAGYGLIGKYSKHIAAAAVIILLAVGCYTQLTYANNLINSKKDSFSQHKDAGEWLKERTNKGDTIVGCGLSVNLIYYSERNFQSAAKKEQADAFIEQYKPKYTLIDAFDPACSTNYFAENPDRFKPVQAFFIDKEKTQAVMIIYEVSYGV